MLAFVDDESLDLTTVKIHTTQRSQRPGPNLVSQLRNDGILHVLYDRAHLNTMGGAVQDRMARFTLETETGKKKQNKK